MSQFQSVNLKSFFDFRILFILIFLNSCAVDHVENNHKYGLIVYDQHQDAAVFMPASSLWDGKPVAKGIDVPGMTIAVYDQHYLLMDRKDQSLLKYRATPEGLVLEGTIDMKPFAWEPYSSWVNWVNEHTVLMGSVVNEKFQYIEIELKEMKVQRSGTLAVPLAPKGLNYTGIFAKLLNNRLFVFYTFQKGFMREHVNPPDDAVHTSIFSYPELQMQNSFEDKRTTWPGSYNGWSSNSVLLNDTIYVLGQPGGRTGNHPVAPSAVLRLNKGANAFDPNYLFKLGSHGAQEAYTLFNLGHGLALTKIVESARISRFDDYLTKRIARYELLDLRRQKRTTLATPAIFLDFNMDVSADENFAYLSVYQQNDKTQLWIYDLRSGVLKRGIQVDGRVMRIDKLSD
ncbi:hypothetical protein [Pedobacter cryoconitis]|uniref:Uncharacterized protein n=1 Tax=Pedobacter cryoconitis TaxID=188932 RepID=A0A7X0J2C0_9SPHI|nr:hypothetical protein [Pedobacter cryoconitis]MBB6499583.1 hypothetical protein [Pedobacter cryoconitis]